MKFRLHMVTLAAMGKILGLDSLVFLSRMGRDVEMHHYFATKSLKSKNTLKIFTKNFMS